MHLEKPSRQGATTVFIEKHMVTIRVALRCHQGCADHVAL